MLTSSVSTVNRGNKEPLVANRYRVQWLVLVFRKTGQLMSVNDADITLLLLQFGNNKWEKMKLLWPVNIGKCFQLIIFTQKCLQVIWTIKNNSWIQYIRKYLCTFWQPLACPWTNLQTLTDIRPSLNQPHECWYQPMQLMSKCQKQAWLVDWPIDQSISGNHYDIWKKKNPHLSAEKMIRWMNNSDTHSFRSKRLQTA